jgi:putative SOS response-associated peptidase YedK
VDVPNRLQAESVTARFFRGKISWADYQARLPVVPPYGFAAPEADPNIAPRTLVPVIRQTPEGDGPDREALQLGPTVWGLIPDWFRGRFDEWRSPAINAHGDDVAESAVFRGAYRHRRCLIPAHGFYVWEGQAGHKTRYAVARRDADWLCFAGVWERALIDGSVYDGLTMLITRPNDLVAGLSGHMPIIIAPDDYEAWLGDRPRDYAPLLRPSPAADLTAWPSHEGYPVWP